LASVRFRPIADTSDRLLSTSKLNFTGLFLAALTAANATSIRSRMVRLSRRDWMRAARLALLRGGIGSVSIEKLARDLRVTKGSFYWHFSGRSELLESLLDEWEADADLLIGALGAPPAQGMQALVDQLAHNVVASESGEVPSDAAIFAWAAIDPEIAERVNTAERERVALLAALIGDRAKAELAYMAYLGFILRRRHSDDPQESFQLVANFFLAALGEEGPETKTGLAFSHLGPGTSKNNQL
jgi:AcrR family transcriptional regulator